jgi:peptidoglycan/xylan/chitin deacetylase (PgdA/CDA1 family)/spore germination protein YaaH/GT2 family glycosyltransferase
MALLLALLTAAVLGIFGASLLVVPVLRGARLRRSAFRPDNPARAGNAPKVRGRVRRERPKTPARTGTVSGQASGVVGAFYVDWDESSLASLQGHAAELTHLFPGWLHLDDTGALVCTDRDPSDDEARQLARQNGIAVVPLLNNFSANKNDFDDDRLHTLLMSPARRAALVEAVHDYLVSGGYAGIDIDLETDDDDDRALLPGLVAEFAARLRPERLLVTACTQAGDPEQATAVAHRCDFIIPMIYDLHWASGTPGPIAPQHWVQAEIDALLQHVPADKIVLALGNYAYDWRRGRAGARTLTFGEAMSTAQDADATVHVDPASSNPTFAYAEGDQAHDVWFLDAVTEYNVERYARARGIDGRALWYIGSEDPTLWTFFGKGKTPHDPAALATVRYGFEVDFDGDGEVLDLAEQPQVGTRRMEVDKDGTITGESFSTYPTPCLVRRSGKAEKEVALTFDDGPDPHWTAVVLDALRREGVPATFFVVGSQVQQYPGLVRRAFDEGHDIGNHSFTHPNLAHTSAARTRLELDATQRAIQAALDRSTTLFRPPYGIDVQPRTAEEMLPIAAARARGYVTVAEGIDPRDWETGPNRRTAAQIADRVIADSLAGAHADTRWKGNIVLLHDAGGDRSATVDAIPLLVRALKAKGYRFVTVSQLLGESRQACFPPLPGKQRLLALFDRMVFGISALGGRLLVGIFLATLVAGSVRLVLVGALAVRHATVPEPPFLTASTGPLVSVVIAAYNEVRVIERTVRALLDSDWTRLEVVVVDDGSTDGTDRVIDAAFAHDPRVRLLRQQNAGKAAAINRGIAQARGELLIGLDADTLFAPDTVSRLVRPFADPRVGAVAGNIQVGNRTNPLTRWQALEYATSQNFDRRACAVLDAIPVVPGCIGAWRLTAVQEAGGYQSDTLAEDADLTWRVHRTGWSIRCDNTALAYTEAPESLSALLKQRFRWTFGTLQVLFKHRDLLFRPSAGWLGMAVAPSLWIFQLLLPILAPAADLGLVLAALSGRLEAAAGYAAAFFAMELAAAALALHLDGVLRQRWGDLVGLVLQRVVYRYLLLVVLWRALSTALRGARAGWGKLERRGTARIHPTATGT